MDLAYASEGLSTSSSSYSRSGDEAPLVSGRYELGYLTYDNRAADPLFQVISRRYERGSLLVTTNLAFKEWGAVFPNAACVTALIDRLTHHAEILPLTGERYRRREAEATQKARRAKA